MQWTDKPNFPIISMPLKDALVLEAYKPKNNSTKGVCENLFYENLTSHFTDIRNSLVLPIEKKKDGYQPDLVYVDESFNLFIDIEIDEPYDGITRKPTHYYNSSDRTRDYYFNEKGWLVIRFTEKQVFCQTKSCCKKIAEVVDKLINTTLLTKFEDIFDLTTEEQWTFEEAEKMALENYREEYLGIEFSGEHIESEELIIESYGNSNQTQTLPQNAKINILAIEFTTELLQKKQQLENLIGKHIRFEYGKNDVTDLVKIIRVEQNRNQLFMLGYSLIDNAENRYELRLIESFEVIENPILMEGNTKEEIEACLNFAIENFKAIKIVYSNKDNEVRTRSVSKLQYENLDGEYYPNYIGYLLHTIKNMDTIYKKDIVRGYCYFRVENRYFYLPYIKSIQILNTEYTGVTLLKLIDISNKQQLQKYNSLGWKNLFLQQFYKAKEDFLKALSIIPDNIMVLGNLAHIHLLLGEYEKAIHIYLAHKGRNFNETTKWEDMVKSDFAEFQKAGIVCNDFEKVLALLEN